jgi:hypothetical protein
MSRPSSTPSDRSCLSLVSTGPAPAARRTIVVGDVHGDCDGLVEVLVHAGLLDAAGRWAGGDARLVQLGDCIDRGLQSDDVLDLLRRLQDEAPATGGEVVRLVGNHEMEPMRGEFGYMRGIRDRQAMRVRLRAEAAEGRLVAAAEVAGWLCIHGGLRPQLGRVLRHEARAAGLGEGLPALVARANGVLREAARSGDFGHALFAHDTGGLWTYADSLARSGGPARIPQIVGHSVKPTPFVHDGILTADQGLSVKMFNTRSYLVIVDGRATWVRRGTSGAWSETSRALDALWTRRVDTSESSAA